MNNSMRCYKCKNCMNVKISEEGIYKTLLSFDPEGFAKPLEKLRVIDNHYLPCMRANYEDDSELEKDWQSFLDYDDAREVLS